MAIINATLAPWPFNPVSGRWESGYMPPDPDNTGYDIYILAGQSNMRGQAGIRAGIDDDYSGLSHVYTWDDATSSITAATNPLPHQDIVAGTTGLWLQFVRNLPTSRKVLVVPVAKGATGFGIHWNKGNAVYNEAVSRVNAAYSSHEDNTIKAFLWHQGETDADNQNTGYLNALKNMRTNMIADVSGLETTTPFIVGSIHEGGDTWKEYINTQLQQFAIDVDVAEYVGMNDLTVFDGTHYNAASLQTAGDRYFTALTGAQLIFRETFESGTLAEKTWISLQSNNQTYSAIVTNNGEKVLRHNGAGEIATPDPISGKTRSGLSTHTFLASTYHTGAQDTSVTLEMDFRLDECFWKTGASDPYPVIAGKLFMSDATVDSEAWYLGLTNNGALTLVSGNSGVSGTTWAGATAGGWCSEAQARPYRWVTSGGVGRNNIYMDSVGKTLFASDGVKRTLRFEIRYNPGGVGHHLGRLSVDGQIFHDNVGINTDVGGWFTLPIEYKLKGCRWYVSSVDVNNPDDVTTHPETYSGYAAGIDTCEYRLYEGTF